MNADTLPKGTCIGRSALRVSDLGELTELYRDIVGLRVLRHSETAAVLGVDGTPLLVLERNKNVPARHRTETGLYHNAFKVPSRAALGNALKRIRSRWQLDGASDHRVSEALYLTDPEGNGVEIYFDRQREQWPVTDDGRVRMTTDPLDLSSIEAAATGGSQMSPETITGHVHLEVSSLEAFKDFYVDTLGFEVQANVPGALFVSDGEYHHHIGANTWNSRTKPAEGRGLSWFEIVVPDSRDFDVVRDRLADRGTPTTETDDGFIVTDPDDIEIRFRSPPK